MPSKLSKIGWYWHRLRAMNAREVALRLQKKAYAHGDARYQNTYSGTLEAAVFPQLPRRENAPPELIEGVRENVEEILRGDWRAFGHLPLKVDDPPRWQFDYLAGRDFQTDQSAFKCDHRAQPGGADIKIIWEPNRWCQLVRLALGAWLFNDNRAREKCLEWLHDWARTNPPFTGLNWTSGLETGIRLIQFTWIDALLESAGAPNKTLRELRRQILPPHIWYTWRYRSFGSSANNHLIGELAGLILALARWPELSALSCTLEHAGALMEKEIRLQFWEDGGNKEQANSYHFFSYEFCFQSIRALEARGVKVSAEVRERLRKAGQFYAATKPEHDPWDYGDSDNACVTPLFAREATFASEWWRWCNNAPSSPALNYWWGGSEAPRPDSPGWRIFEQSGIAVFRSDDWFLRFDFSPLGYLSIAPHGHLDALHLSIWHRGEPIIIDPGTGAYYADKTVRGYLAGWSAHNGPQLKVPPQAYPFRRGIFLWSQHHHVPRFSRVSDSSIRAEITLPYGTATRTVTAGKEIVIKDEFTRFNAAVVATRWKFAPDLRLSQCAPTGFKIRKEADRVTFSFGGGWKMARSFNPPEQLRGKLATTASELGNVPLESLVSPRFRSLAAASYLTLESSEPGPFEVTLSAG